VHNASRGISLGIGQASVIRLDGSDKLPFLEQRNPHSGLIRLLNLIIFIRQSTVDRLAHQLSMRDIWRELQYALQALARSVFNLPLQGEALQVSPGLIEHDCHNG
jgi:hypothetical protein